MPENKTSWVGYDLMITPVAAGCGTGHFRASRFDTEPLNKCIVYLINRGVLLPNMEISLKTQSSSTLDAFRYRIRRLGPSGEPVSTLS